MYLNLIDLSGQLNLLFLFDPERDQAVIGEQLGFGHLNPFDVIVRSNDSLLYLVYCQINIEFPAPQSCWSIVFFHFKIN